MVVLTGPSGSGKSRLAQRLGERHGWPVVTLDDYYADDDPDDPDLTLPMSPLGLVDWDDVGSWHRDRAVAGLVTLCRTGSLEMPEYDLSTSRAVGTKTVTTGGSPFVVAEGIFAAHTIAPLRDEGLLAAAWCIRNRPWVTFARRLARDLAERRKPPLTLWRRGHVLRRAEPGIVTAQQELGAEPITAAAAERCSDRLGAGDGVFSFPDHSDTDTGTDTDTATDTATDTETEGYQR